MKTNAPKPSALAGTSNAEADGFPPSPRFGAASINAAAVPSAASLSNEQLLRLGTIYTELQMSLVFGVDQPVTRGVMAGIVATLHEILPARQFHAVMIQWDVDAIKLSELLNLAGADQQEQTESTEKHQPIEA